MDIDIVPCDYSGMCPYVDDGHSCEDRCERERTKQKGERDNESEYLLRIVKEI